MKKGKLILKRATGALLALLLFISLMPIGTLATVDYWETTIFLGRAQVEKHGLGYACWECGFSHKIFDWDDYYESGDPSPDGFDEYFCDECGLCWGCAYDIWHCNGCDKCLYNETPIIDYCRICGYCSSCWDEDMHCPYCFLHTDERCGQCSTNACYYCHDDQNLWCDYCGSCLYAAYENGTICVSCNHHCSDCCVICEDCGHCFASASNEAPEDVFCSDCGLCIKCAVKNWEHCMDCNKCYSDVTKCEASDENYCVSCCADHGNHCPDCGIHVEEWCPTDPEAHCIDCADICEGCGECVYCMEIDFCDDCDLCTKCCLDASEAEGCECGLCVYSADFVDPEHLCERCGVAFSCVEEFCDDCGLCFDCCLETSEEEGCECGICVGNEEFYDSATHYCDNCGGFTCVNGEICEYCGFCEECCLDASETAGCDCGLCVEDSDFYDSDHLCENCETNFSCTTDFCTDCGYCVDCCVLACEAMGCSHEICVMSDAWNDHFCAECNHCKEDCDCGLPCCATGDCGCGCGVCTGSADCACCENCTCSYERSVNHVMGGILSQPRNIGANVSDGSTDDYKHTNRISFYVEVFGDSNEIYYQWYRKAGAEGQPEMLVDEAAGDEEYWGRNDFITSGATESTLITYVPADACVVDYFYFCEITDRNGNLLSRTRDAKLRAHHRYKWMPTEGGHFYRCVGCAGSGKFGSDVCGHEFAERQILVYPTETEPGLLGNRCRVCGYESGDEIAALGRHDRHIFQYYSNSREHWCECVCGKKINARSEHSWGDWILDQAATEKTKGSKHRFCLVCGYRQDSTIQKKIHAHGAYFSGDEYARSFHKKTSKLHGRICDDPECGQWYDVAPHSFGEWEVTVYPTFDSDGSMRRVCTGCSYTQEKTLTKFGSERKRIIAVENGESTRAMSRFSGTDTPVLTAEERPGYEFACWNCDLVYRVARDDYLHVASVDLLTPVMASYTGRTDVIKVDDPNAKVMTVLSVPNSMNVLANEEIKNEDECYLVFYPQYTRFPLTVAVWPENSSRREDRVILSPWEYYDPNTRSARRASQGMHMGLWLEEIETEETGVAYPYEYILHMNGYKGGPIKILSPDMDYQMNARVAISIEDTESVIRSTAGQNYGIEVNSFNGGEVTMYSENGGKLTIDVENSGISVYGIDVADNIGRTSLFLNNADLDIVSTNLSKPSPRIEQSAEGIHAGDVRIVGGNISIEAHAPRLNNEYAAVGINAEGSIDIDSPALYIDVTDVDTGAGGTGAGLNAKIVEVSMLSAKLLSEWYGEEDAGLMEEAADVDSYAAGVFIDYPENGFAMKLPREDPAGMAAITTYSESEGGSLNYTHCLGYTVQVDYDPDKLSLSPVGRVYVDEAGRFCVPAGESLEFVAAAEPGYRGNNIGLYRDGKEFIRPEIDENENRRYRIESVTECMTLTLGGVQPVEPFATAPLPSTQTVLGGGLGTAAVTWEMNAFEVYKLYRKNSGSQTANGVLQRHDAENVLRADTAYSDGVMLQSYNTATGRWINRPELGTFPAKQHAFAEFTETRNYSRPGTTTLYRLAVLFDGLNYYSEPFEVTWTADGEAVSSRIASAVELYMTDAWNSNGASTIYDGFDSGTWMRLDARFPDIYYDTDSGLYTNEFNRTHKVPEDGYIRFAHFDASRGILTLDGDTDIPALHEIRTAEDSFGDLTVYAAGNCAIEQNTASVAWIDRWGDGNLIHCADNAAILNDTGSVILSGAPGAGLTIRAYGPYNMVREEREDGSYYYTGERISAVRASGDVRAVGPFSLEIYADCEKEVDPEPGYYGCAVGLDAKGDILIGGDTTLWVSVGMGCAERAGAAQAMYAAGHIRMEDNCSVEIQTNGEVSPSLYCSDLSSVWSEKTVTVDGHASVRISSSGKEWCAVYAAEGAYICSDRAAYISTFPESDEIDTSAIISPRTVVTGFHSFTWRDPDSDGPTTGELCFGDENTYVTYISEPDFAGLRTLTVMDGLPRSLEVITQGLSTDETQIEISRNGDTAAVFGKEFPVCPGDTVTLYPPEGLPGSEFVRWGWPQYGPRDILDLGGGAIRFTMPDWDITPIAVFDTNVISDFAFTLDGSDPAMTGDHRIGKADIGFRVEIPADFVPGTRLAAYAKLECTYENEDGELVWSDSEHEPVNHYSYLYSGDAAYDRVKGAALFDVSETLYLADVVPTELTPGEWVRIYESPDRSYRLRITLYTVETVADRDRYTEWCTLTTNPFELSWNKPFTVDVDGEGRNPEIFIPSGDVGTAFSLDFSKYVSGGSGRYHYSILPAPEPIPMEFAFNEDRGTFCFFHTESSVGMNYADNCVQVQDVLTGDIELIYFDVMPTLDTQMYDTYVGGVHISEYNREDVLGDGKVSYTPAEGGEPARLTLRDVTLNSGFCDRRDPAVYGENAFAAVFTREDLEIVAEGKNLINLDENSVAEGDPYVQDSLITGIYGFGANVTLSGSGSLTVRSRRGFCLAEDGGHHGGSLTLSGCSLAVDVAEGNVFGKPGSAGFTYAGGSLYARSAPDSDTVLLNGVAFADGTQESSVFLLSADPSPENAQPGSTDMLADQQPGDLFHYIRIKPADRLNDDPIVHGLVDTESGKVSVIVNKSAKGVDTMKAIVAVYEKTTGRFLTLWTGEIDPNDPLTDSGLPYDESYCYSIMVLDGDDWRPLGDSYDF